HALEPDFIPMLVGDPGLAEGLDGGKRGFARIGHDRQANRSSAGSDRRRGRSEPLSVGSGTRCKSLSPAVRARLGTSASRRPARVPSSFYAGPAYPGVAERIGVANLLPGPRRVGHPALDHIE